ncbi:MAG: single-stranded-DNA-specific exonuclease RecJ [Deltaproteobacteria bacterium]|nr:single-stranded-DNA-specific exonuclease RecJ [Deltaproteobacteria bacterium]MBT6434056.1 single-stranded-DNA-specific exonuclease RecJ [Deltaproteobacteria bacterium]MBT6490157.1 single-stranded-DNA-specific exonuclease RecJ [Deltaproteobacteria bacterium]
MSDLSYTGKKWVWPEMKSHPQPTPLAPWLMTILGSRGIQTEDIPEYLDKSLKTLHDPRLMADMEPAVSRLCEAITSGEPITVYGDYDVDGVCSTTVLVEFLRQVGAVVSFYIPDRRAEGYGLNVDAVLNIATQSKVLITTDCGITAYDEVCAANEAGLDVIIVDHHQVPEAMPPAVACLNPHRPDCNYPFKELCAAGVAFILVAGLRRELRDRDFFKDGREPDVRTLLDIVAVATVADMVPICGNNRALVFAGLRQMSHAARPGLKALMKVSDVEADRICASDLGFKIGPRINARGRLDHAGAAVDLMLTHDIKQAEALAQALDDANQNRRQIEQAAVESAIDAVENEGYLNYAALVIYHPQWHPGVLGLVASRLVRRFHRPTIVIGEGGKGSARSIPGFDIYSGIETAAHHLERFGGHKAAAGLTIAEDNIEGFRRDFIGVVQSSIGAPPYIPVLQPDLEMDAETLELQMVDELAALGPFGQKNPEPLLVSRGVSIRDRRIVGKDHLKLNLGERGIDAIAFGFGPYMNKMPEKIDVAYRIERNVFRGRENLQLMVEDIRPHETQPPETEVVLDSI